MNLAMILQLIGAAAALAGQVGPMWAQVKTAVESGDDAQVADLLKRLQAVNDQLGTA